MRLGELKGDGAHRMRRVAARILMVVAAVPLPAIAQTFSLFPAAAPMSTAMPDEFDEPAATDASDATTQASNEDAAQQATLLGAPSELDGDWLKQFGAPTEASTGPSRSFQREPLTPTEALLAGGSGLTLQSAASGSPRARPKLEMPDGSPDSADGSYARPGAAALQSVSAVPGASPFGATQVYRSPW